jgi:hypothetical protein
LSIKSGPYGESRHRLTDDSVAAVAAALGVNICGAAANALASVDTTLDDPDAVVAMGMSRLAATLLLRVQRSTGLSMDDTIKAIAGHADTG